MPSGVSASRLPLGLQFVSGMFIEAALLAAAAWCEDVLGRGHAPKL
jgi:Asp-tRNA(Asn)/Glu-tRNA(Gln) amidotransferase A subunit family amidase